MKKNFDYSELEKRMKRFGEIKSKFLFCLDLSLFSNSDDECFVEEEVYKLVDLQFSFSKEFWIRSNTLLEYLNTLMKMYHHE